MGCLRSFLSGLVGLPRVGAAADESSLSPPILFPFYFCISRGLTVAQTDLEFKDPPAAASQVLGLEMRTASPGLPAFSRLICPSLFWLLIWFLHLHPLSRTAEHIQPRAWCPRHTGSLCSYVRVALLGGPKLCRFR